MQDQVVLQRKFRKALPLILERFAEQEDHRSYRNDPRCSADALDDYGPEDLEVLRDQAGEINWLVGVSEFVPDEHADGGDQPDQRPGERTESG